MIIFVLLSFIIIFLVFSLIFIKNKYFKLKNDVNKIYLALKRVRYGDINVRVENLNNKDLENITNRLFETMYDREMMIKEYQSTLSNKNISLEEIIKHEKQLQMFKEEFAATLTHDMKVPVIAELNSLNYLLEGRFGPLNDKQIELMKLMKSSNEELKELIENMLETYRLEQNSIILNKTKTSINNFIEILADEMEPIALNTGHKIILNISKTENKEGYFDSFQLKRVLKNIIQNAITFSPENSEIKLITDYSNDKITFSVINKGSTISSNDIELIFQKYYSSNSKFKKAGTGLGLYLAGKIIEAHNGSIQVDCSKKDYTSFIIEIPN